MRFFMEYEADDPLNLPYEEEVAICDYTQMTPKKFFNEFVSQYRPCLFKGYAKTWPAYDKWSNDTYMKEMAGKEVIYPER